MKRFVRCRAFTLIELLVVIAIIAVLIGLLLSAVQQARTSAEVTQTANNLRQIALATQEFNDAQGRLPVPWEPEGTFGIRSPMVQVLPYVEQQNLQRLADSTTSGWPSNYVPIYVSPLDKDATNSAIWNATGYPCDYAFNVRLIGDVTRTCNGINACPGLTSPGRRIPDSIPDGASNTILLVTKYYVCGSGGTVWSHIVLKATPPQFNTGWSLTSGPYFALSMPDESGAGATFQPRPPAPACNTEYAQSFTAAGIQAALADGSCRVISPNVSGLTWRNALLPDDGQVLGSDWND